MLGAQADFTVIRVASCLVIILVALAIYYFFCVKPVYAYARSADEEFSSVIWVEKLKEKLEKVADKYHSLAAKINKLLEPQEREKVRRYTQV